MYSNQRPAMLQAIGYWREDNPLGIVCFPHPRELVDPNWRLEERSRIADYLARGVYLRGYFGFSHCRFRDGPPDEEMGTDDLTDGRWVWPQALPLYVSRYCVRLPREFLDYARKVDYVIPSDLCVEELRERQYSYRFWIRWARRHRSNVLFALLSFPFGIPYA